MAKTTAGLLSLGASGTIGKTMTFATWKGVPYARQRVVPANPQTVAQQTVRKTFALLREMWKIAPPMVQQAWDTFASGRPFTGMNKWVGENVRVLQSQVDMTNTIFSPGARGGLAPVDVVFAPGGLAGEIDVTFTMPTPPAGWTITAAQAAVFLDQAPDGFFTGPFLALEDTTSSYEVNFTGLEPGEDYIVGGWIKWLKPDNKVAYSVSLSDKITATP